MRIVESKTYVTNLHDYLHQRLPTGFNVAINDCSPSEASKGCDRTIAKSLISQLLVTTASATTVGGGRSVCIILGARSNLGYVAAGHRGVGLVLYVDICCLILQPPPIFIHAP